MNVTPKPHLHQDWIDPHAIGIVRALQKKGFTTYLVGGCVRDLLIGIHPKDFDIATTARPEEVKSAIHRAYVIGKRFRLVLVRREEMQFEVATFRRELKAEEKVELAEGEDSGAPAGDNIFGSPEDDARRRDFTINGLFYDPIGDQLIDFADGLPDLEAGWIRMIGDPMKRLVEDPIRILRALRLKHMISFALDPELRRAMVECASSLPSTVLPRRREEILKLLRLKRPDLAFREAHDMGLLKYLSPTLDKYFEQHGPDLFLHYLAQMEGTREAGISPADLFSLLVHSFVRAYMQPEPASGPAAREVLEGEEFQKWMRDELGMFKFEQALVVKALLVEPLLAKRKDFQRKGERRQNALLVNDAFPLSLRFADRDYFLSCEDLLYWQQKYASVGSIPRGGGGGEGRARRRRRRPRKPRRDGSAKAEEVSSST